MHSIAHEAIGQPVPNIAPLDRGLKPELLSSFSLAFSLSQTLPRLIGD